MMNSTPDLSKGIFQADLKSFQHAFNGLKEATGTQPNFRIHIAATLLAIAAGLFFQITATEWCLVLIAIGLVTAAECFNTALEYLTNLVSPNYNQLAGKVKDLSAAGVLLCSLIAFGTGIIIFIPKIISLFN